MEIISALHLPVQMQLASAPRPTLSLHTRGVSDADTAAVVVMMANEGHSGDMRGKAIMIHPVTWV